MLKWYGCLGLAMIIFAQINFVTAIQPFAAWYIPIVWWGFILFVDSIVYRIKKKSMVMTYPKELAFLALLSILFWSIFELYNLFTHTWTYIHYVWYMHIVDFTVIMPAFIETFCLLKVLGIGKGLDKRKRNASASSKYRWTIWLLVALGAIMTVVPFIAPKIGFAFMWTGLLLFLDPLNYLTKRPSLFQIASAGRKSILFQTGIAGLITGFFWELWNYLAYPKWFYAFSPAIKLFEMPIVGYIGYVTFAGEVLLFFALFRSFVFKDRNDLLYG